MRNISPSKKSGYKNSIAGLILCINLRSMFDKVFNNFKIPFSGRYFKRSNASFVSYTAININTLVNELCNFI